MNPQHSPESSFDLATLVLFCLIGAVVFFGGMFINDCLTHREIRHQVSRERVLDCLAHYRPGASVLSSDLLLDITALAQPYHPGNSLSFRVELDRYSPKALDDVLSALERDGRVVITHQTGDPKVNGRPERLVRLVSEPATVALSSASGRYFDSARQVGRSGQSGRSVVTQVRGEVIDINAPAPSAASVEGEA